MRPEFQSTAFALFLISYWFAVPCHAATASFSCANASAPVERVICSDDGLAALDKQMGEAFGVYLQGGEEDHRQRLDQQRGWLKRRLTACNIPGQGEIDPERKSRAAACLIPLYQRQIAFIGRGATGQQGDGGHAQKTDDEPGCAALSKEISDFSFQQKPPTGSILEALAKSGSDLVQLDNGGAGLSRGALEKAARERLHFSVDDLDKIDGSDGSEFIRLRKLGHSTVVASETVGGTAHCQTFQFFDATGKGPARPIADPEPPYEGYCWGDSFGDYATLGQIGGRPTFAVESFGSGSEDIHLIARINDRWVKSCHLAVKWAPVFNVATDNCDGPACSAMRRMVIQAAAQMAGTQDIASYWQKISITATPGDRKALFEDYFPGVLKSKLMTWPVDARAILSAATYRTMSLGNHAITFVTVSAKAENSQREEHKDYAILGDHASDVPQIVDMSAEQGDGPMAVLARSPVEIPGNPYTMLGSDSTIFPVVLGGAPYIVRIGHGHFGWRTTDDYLAILLAPDGEGFFKQAAGFYISKTRGRSVNIDILN